MSELNNLGTSLVARVDERTGLPIDQYGRLLSRINPATGEMEKDWDKPGTELYNLTNPYGLLQFCIGGADDFWCFDYAVVGDWLILDSVINSESGSFIMGAEYNVINVGEAEDQPLFAAYHMTLRALEWCHENKVHHNRRGWNQDIWYFTRCVHLRLMRRYMITVPEFSERQKRFGGMRIDRFCQVRP